MKWIIPLLLLSGPLQAATITVCASGCSQTTLQAAVNAHNPGDIIEMAAGENFTLTSVTWPWRANPNKLWTTVRTSRWKELPSPGTRVSPEQHQALMPHLTPFDQYSAVIQFGHGQGEILSVSTTTDKISLDSSADLVDGDPIACRTIGSLPGGVTENKVYLMANVVLSTFTLVDRETGVPVDIVNSTGISRGFCTPVKVGGYVRFEGIDISPIPGNPTNYNLVWVGIGEETAIEGTPHHVEFRHCIIRGLPDEEGPRNLLVMNGRYLRVEDSWLAHAKQYSSETHAISLVQTPGPVWIRNNYLNAASINILSGGAGTGIRDQVTTDMVVENNHIQKLGYQLYMSSAGPPTGSCLSGRYHRDTSVSPNDCAHGACYTCVNSAWVQDTAGTYRSATYLTKNMIEFKHCLRCKLENNWIDTGFDAEDTGNPAYCFFLSSYLKATNRDIVFRNNRCDKTWTGFAAADSDRANSAGNGPVVIENNLNTNMGIWPEYSIWQVENTGGQRRGFYFTSSYDSITVNHNTIRANGNTTSGMLFSYAEAGPLPNFNVRNNIIPQGYYPVHVDDASETTCSPTGIGVIVGDPVNRFKNNILYGASSPLPYACAFENGASPTSVDFVSATDSHLISTSPYSAACASGCSFTGTDGTDIGADVNKVDALTSGAYDGVKPWLSDLYVKAGSTWTIVTYTAPSASACTVYLSTHARRLSGDYHADTTSSGASDSRTGSVTNGIKRQFVYGSVSPLTASTQYYGDVVCGSQRKPFEFQTKAAGSNSVDWFVRPPSTTTGSICTDAAMTSGCTAISSSSRHVISIPAKSVRYYQWAGGPVLAGVAP